jgi:hypothetical protein
MSRILQHTRINSLPIPEPMAAGTLESFAVLLRGTRRDLVLDYLALVASRPGRIERSTAGITESLEGSLEPRRLRFLGIEDLQVIGLYEQLDSLPGDAPARTIVDLLAFRGLGERLDSYLLFGRSVEDAELRFHARGVLREPRRGLARAVQIERDWSPAPPLAPGLVPRPRRLHQQYAGDPILLHLDGRRFSRRLFLGGLDLQSPARPDVHAVLNLTEQPSRWVKDGRAAREDRWSVQGEGSLGMSVEQILEESAWVLERLRAGQRVLVHCQAGMNRSATIVCAVLIRLEGLSAEAALSRVRATHPWSRPDSHHWLRLRWLAELERAV